MDFLGLRNLTVIDDALRNIEPNRGDDRRAGALPLDDAATYELLARGDTLGVFQLDGGPMRSLLRLMKPDNFEDISAVLALYRPGPMGANSHTNYALRKNGLQEITPIHPELEEPLAEILAPTYGLIVYQEQVMAIAQKLAGYSLGAADLLRRAMGKKKKEVLDKEYVAFRDGMRANGLLRRRDQGAVGHPGPVLRLRVQQGAHRRLRAGLLLDGLPQGELPGRVHGRAAHLRRRRQGQVGDLPGRVPPHGHQGAAAGRQRLRRRSSPRSATTSASACRRSATSGTTWSPRSCATREEKGEFTDFDDFLRKVDAVVCNKRTIESLIKAGAFDSLGHSRRGLMNAVHAGRRRGARRQAQRGDRPVRPVRRLSDDDRTPATTSFAVSIAAGEWDKKVLLAVRARDARPLRLRPPAVRAGARAGLGGRHARSRLAQTEGAGRAALGHPGRHPVRGAPPGHQAGQPWARPPWRTSTGAIEALFFPQTYAAGRPAHRRGRDRGRQGPRSTGATTRPKLIAMRHRRAGHVRAAPAAR